MARFMADLVVIVRQVDAAELNFARSYTLWQGTKTGLPWRDRADGAF
jgi:hypothetical protein